MSTTNQTEEEEYPFIVELNEPFPWDGEKLTVLRFRQPFGKDLMQAGVTFGAGSLSMEEMIRVASIVSPYGLTLFERLPADAFWDVGALMGKSLDRALGTGKKSSGTSPQSLETPEVG